MADPSRKRKMDVPGAGGPSKRTVEESAAALAAELEMEGDVLEVEVCPFSYIHVDEICALISR